MADHHGLHWMALLQRMNRHTKAGVRAETGDSARGAPRNLAVLYWGMLQGAGCPPCTTQLNASHLPSSSILPPGAPTCLCYPSSHRQPQPAVLGISQMGPVQQSWPQGANTAHTTCGQSSFSNKCLSRAALSMVPRLCPTARSAHACATEIGEVASKH